ncbi:MAG: GAP family protein [Propioniciclava sp.]
MVNVIAENLSSILAVDFSPMPRVALLFLLMTRGRTAASVWTMGCLVAVLIVTGGSALAGHTGPGQTATGGADSGGVNWLAWIVALLFLALSVNAFKKMPKEGETAPTPGWIDSLSQANIGVVFVLSVGLLLINPKNLSMYLSMGTTISAAGLPGASSWIAIIICTVLASLTPLAITVVAYALGDRATAGLGALRDWLVQHNSVVMGTLFLVLGVAQLGKAISSLGG